MTDDDSFEELNDFTRELLRNYLDAPDGQHDRVTKEWYHKVEQRFGSKKAEFALLLRTMLNSRGNTTTVLGDYSVSNISAGGNMANVNTGAGAIFIARDVNTYNSGVDNSSNIKNEMKSLLKAGRDAIEKWDTDSDAKSAILQNFEKLTAELDKPNPKKSVLEILWGGITAAAKVLEPVAKIGVAIAAAYGITHG